MSLSSDEAAVAVPSSSSERKPRGKKYVSSYTMNDVLLGRGKQVNGHDGNIKFRKIVYAKWKDYTGRAKSRVARDISNEVKASGGKFLRKVCSHEVDGEVEGGLSKDGEAWEIVEEAVVTQKIKQAFRDLNAASRREAAEDKKKKAASMPDDGGGAAHLSPRSDYNRAVNATAMSADNNPDHDDFGVSTLRKALQLRHFRASAAAGGDELRSPGRLTDLDRLRAGLHPLDQHATLNLSSSLGLDRTLERHSRLEALSGDSLRASVDSRRPLAASLHPDMASLESSAGLGLSRATDSNLMERLRMLDRQEAREKLLLEQQQQRNSYASSAASALNWPSADPLGSLSSGAAQLGSFLAPNNLLPSRSDIEILSERDRLRRQHEELVYLRARQQQSLLRSELGAAGLSSSSAAASFGNSDRLSSALVDDRRFPGANLSRLELVTRLRNQVDLEDLERSTELDRLRTAARNAEPR